MMIVVYTKPFGFPMQLQGVAVEVVVGRDKIDIWISLKEISHQVKLIGQVKVVVLGKVDEFRVILSQENLDLPVEGLIISDPLQREQH